MSASTPRTTCPFCGCARNGRDLTGLCPSCQRTHAEASYDVAQTLARASGGNVPMVPTGRVFVVCGFPIVEVR